MDVNGQLWPPRQRLLDRAEEAGLLLLQHKDQLHLDRIIIFGSLARGEADYRSDVDIMAVVQGGPKESSKAKDFILANLADCFEGEFPKIDCHTCATSVYDNPDISNIDGTVFGDFLACVKKDGVQIWPK